MNYVGIDVGKRKCQAYVMNEESLIVDDFIFSNDSDGISTLLSKLDSDCKAVVESTGNMWVDM